MCVCDWSVRAMLSCVWLFATHKRGYEWSKYRQASKVKCVWWQARIAHWGKHCDCEEWPTRSCFQPTLADWMKVWLAAAAVEWTLTTEQDLVSRRRRQLLFLTNSCCTQLASGKVVAGRQAGRHTVFSVCCLKLKRRRLFGMSTCAQLISGDLLLLPLLPLLWLCSPSLSLSHSLTLSLSHRQMPLMFGLLSLSHCPNEV